MPVTFIGRVKCRGFVLLMLMIAVAPPEFLSPQEWHVLMGLFLKKVYSKPSI
jgi:hypothetical protein